MQLIDLFVTILLAAVSGGLLSQIFGAIVNRRKLSVDIDKTKAETKSLEISAAINLANGLSARLDDLENDFILERSTRKKQEELLKQEQTERKKLLLKVDYLVNGIQLLTDQIKRLGLKPAFELPPKEEFDAYIEAQLKSETN